MGITTDAAEAAGATELRRQRAVESLGLQERRRDERLDRITRLARRVFAVDGSAITVLDQDRAWFPGACGFDPVDVARSDTFCARVTDERELVVVEEARTDPRFAAHPAVLAGAVRFYAGRPLRDPLGNVLAVLCIFAATPRTLDGEDLQILDDLAAWAEQVLIGSTEMSQAGRIQASMLPRSGIQAEEWELDAICLPALAVGGDFYDYGIGDGVLHVGLSDVMGKGAGAALVGAGIRTAIRATHAALTAGVDLGVTTTQVARGVLRDLERAESFATLFEAAVDVEDGYMRYVDAGMGLCLLVRRGGEVVRLNSSDRPLGVLPDDHWTEQHATIEPGDRLLLFSDGLLDLLDDPIDWCEPVADLVRAHHSVPALLAAIEDLARHRVPLDDVTALALFRRDAGAAEP